MPFTDDFSDCGDNWLEDDTDVFSFSCEDGHYHVVVKTAESGQSSITALSDPVDRVSISVEARAPDTDRLEAIGLGCWHGRENGSPGYRVLIGAEGWNILKEQPDGTADSIPATESGLDIPASDDEDSIRMRAECVAGSSETTIKLFLNGTLAGTGHDSEGVDGFDQLGLMVSATDPPVAVDFDNFHVEEPEPGP